MDDRDLKHINKCFNAQQRPQPANLTRAAAPDAPTSETLHVEREAYIKQEH